MKKVVVFLASALLLATPMMAAAAISGATYGTGIIGDCSDCHTMHNSVEGQAVAKVGLNGSPSTTPIQNLLKYDCIACHADPTGLSATGTIGGGSTVPLVYWNNSDGSGQDLAGGNFFYSDAAGETAGIQSQRHGHNVMDITAADNSNAGAYNSPPGMYHGSSHENVFSSNKTDGAPMGTWDPTGGYSGTGEVVWAGKAFGAFTCAGARGCHGVRFQLMDNSASNAAGFTYRRGIAAISGAHHNSYDGYKAGDLAAQGPETGAEVANGYRFIPGLKGFGNTEDRWENVNDTSHNEYYGKVGGITDEHCDTCHDSDLGGHTPSKNSLLKVPNNSMSGFCSTCHGMFHSGGTAANPDLEKNGTEGAFLRHPSDFALPSSGEYKNYATYDVTAPVARQAISSSTTVGGSINKGSDMVMCLSCHEAHATPNDFMLRFQYEGNMKAGHYASVQDAQDAGGCLACHTEKGVLPQSR